MRSGLIFPVLELSQWWTGSDCREISLVERAFRLWTFSIVTHLAERLMNISLDNLI